MLIFEGVEYENYEFHRNVNRVWSYNKNIYLKECPNEHGYYLIQLRKNGKTKNVRMHRLIYWMHHPITNFTLKIDHIDVNKQNNKLDNIRLATSSQNGFNRNKQQNTSSQYFNVTWHKHAKKWCSYINTNGKQENIGYFDNELDAAKSYDNYVINNNLNDGFRKLNNV
jgi:hypothetical protein